MADDSGIDPRYAAQFQRGFDPARDAPPVRRGPVRLEGGPPATARRVQDSPRMIPTRAPEAVNEMAPEPDVIESFRTASTTWWDWLLPGIGVGLIVIALMMWWSLGTDTGMYSGIGPTDEWAMFWQTLRGVLPGSLVTAGMVALATGIALQALGRRR